MAKHTNALNFFFNIDLVKKYGIVRRWLQWHTQCFMSIPQNIAKINTLTVCC